ncbi:hypothetical protein [Nonomuraea basaltis]|uniref:hypothetical protein n=1 Tax=Nonomuraea basaltis TaxID=2495887 RepID=UPI00110C6B3E|nr:hypothetical protein [Nonomuraea basaltis]TMR99645.1 hypothetical protein EJK15_06235 [Nonomuraea basaltis]
MRVQLVVPVAALLFSHVSAAQAADVVEYECTTTASNDRQNIKVDVELTVPAGVGVDENLTIGWKGSYSGGTELLAPTTGLEDGLNLYAYAGIRGIDKLTSATGVAQLGTITPGARIPLPTTTVNLTTTPQEEGEGTVHAAAINFGPSPQEPVIECEVLNKSALTEYPLKVGTGDGTTTPSSTPSPSTTETDDGDNEDNGDDTTTPEVTTTVTTTTTPEGGVDTGGGGEAGPDGRAVMLAGSLLILAAGAGLWLRRPRPAP